MGLAQSTAQGSSAGIKGATATRHGLPAAQIELQAAPVVNDYLQPPAGDPQMELGPTAHPEAHRRGPERIKADNPGLMRALESARLRG